MNHTPREALTWYIDARIKDENKHNEAIKQLFGKQFTKQEVKIMADYLLVLLNPYRK